MLLVCLEFMVLQSNPVNVTPDKVTLHVSSHNFISQPASIEVNVNELHFVSLRTMSRIAILVWLLNITNVINAASNWLGILWESAYSRHWLVTSFSALHQLMAITSYRHELLQIAGCLLLHLAAGRANRGESMQLTLPLAPCLSCELNARHVVTFKHPSS